ncbi:MAG: hypothetical protein IJ141_02345 [Lachnospiraceae bacterium]|nr:hypothetical protein [Lachnospiraceae bacterium]
MASVTGRIKEIKQPRGGYVKASSMHVENLNDGLTPNEKENLPGNIVGLVVDYMTRFILSNDAEKAFFNSLLGAGIADEFGKKGSLNEGITFFKLIKGIDDESIINACKLVKYDAWLRNKIYMAVMYKLRGQNDNTDDVPDKATIENIRLFINRSLCFFEKYGPIVREHLTFEPPNSTKEMYKKWSETKDYAFGGYTHLVDSGDGDFITSDTLWDFKVLRSNPNSKHTMQILMYWIMGKHSRQECYKNINKIGIFNPRLNKVYTFDVNDLPYKTIDIIEKDVFNYY